MNEEIKHHGTKGMKWGRRLYQNKDGTLTALGKKRYNKELAKAKEGIKIQKNKARTQAKIDKLKELQKQARGETDDTKPEKKIKGKADTTPKKKSISDMTDEELNTAINRARMEDTYKSLRPEEVSKGKAVTDTLINKVIAPAAINAGRRFLENALNKAADNVFKEAADPNSIEALRKTAEKLELQKKIKNLKSGKDSMPEVKTWDDVTKKFDYEQKKSKAEAEASKSDKKSSTTKSTNTDRSESDTQNSNKEEPKSSNTKTKTKNQTSSKKDEPEYAEGEVIGEGKSRKQTENTKQKPADYYDPIDAEVVNETPVSNLPATTVSTGRSYIMALLEDYSR